MIRIQCYDLEKYADGILDLLENIGFQAPNCIELFEEHYIFTAKKMHHWDNGL